VFVVIAIVLVIVVFPVAIGVPAMSIFIPPFVICGVAMLAGFREIFSRMLGLPAAVAVMFNGFVQFVVGLGETHLASGIVIRAAGGRVERGKGRQGCGHQRGLSEVLCPMMRQIHEFSPCEEILDKGA
jgi:hypothetical protein